MRKMEVKFSAVCWGDLDVLAEENAKEYMVLPDVEIRLDVTEEIKYGDLKELFDRFCIALGYGDYRDKGDK